MPGAGSRTTAQTLGAAELDPTAAQQATRLASVWETGETLRALIGASPAAIVASDLDGRVTLWNAAAERLFGWPAGEILGQPVPTIPDDVRGTYAAERERILAGMTYRAEDRLRRTRDGSLVEVTLSSAPVRDAGGDVRGIVSVLVDVTERGRAERALRAREQELRQAQKMEAIGKLAGGVAHDFNNLLVVILGYSQILLDRLGADDPARGEIETIERVAGRAASLVAQLLAFGRRQVLRPKLLQLNAIVQELETMLRRVIPESIELVSILEPDLPAVCADPGQVEQVLMNLALNARDAMPGGGSLTIATSSCALSEPPAWSDVLGPGPYALLSVVDTGCGMDEETQSRVFEPFFTTKPAGEGSGLGLATVYGIVKQSGGDVSVDSEPGRGTTFAVYLPATASRPEPELKPPPPPLTSGPETILLVEDEDVVRGLMVETLRARGYEVLAASNGLEALELYEEHTGTIDLVVSDVVMPQLSGPELAERLAARFPGTRVLFISGYADEALRQASAFARAPLLRKPFRPDALARAVRELLDAPRA